MRDEAIRKEQLERNWAERESALQAREKEVVELRTRVAGIPAEIDFAVKRETSIVGNSVKRDYEQQLKIVQLNADNDRKMSEAGTKSLTDTIGTLRSQITTLQSEVASANTRAEAIAAKALESASGRQALEAVERANVSRENGTNGNGR